VGSATSGTGDGLPALVVQIEDDDLRTRVLEQLERAGGPLRSARRRGSRLVRVCVPPMRASDRGDLCVVIVPGQDRSAARRAFAAGAAGIVFTDDLAALAATVRAVAGGQLVVPSALRAAIVKPVLTTREKQILAMVVIGLSNREIAEKLFLAESTVKSHLFSAFRRLGVRTRREATALILDRDQGLGSGILTITQ
jgi:DNA-binding CsgD family transcriptional regulator